LSNVVDRSVNTHSHLWYICLRSIRPAEQNGSSPDSHAGSKSITVSHTIVAFQIAGYC
jgi:hypothetical protein